MNWQLLLNKQVALWRSPGKGYISQGRIAEKEVWAWKMNIFYFSSLTRQGAKGKVSRTCIIRFTELKNVVKKAIPLLSHLRKRLVLLITDTEWLSLNLINNNNNEINLLTFQNLLWIMVNTNMNEVDDHE